MKRGDVVLVRLPSVDPASPTHVQRGPRPAVIVQSDALTSPAPVIQVVPATSNQRAMRYSCSLLVQPDSMNGLNMPSVLIVTQLGAVDAARIESRLGTLSPADLQALERGIKMLLDLQ
jgi:mRNA-degrading endonuclease toxin of MazEF toxin-antitoxin module